jgi:serine palmitoyltransferase
MVPTRDVNVFSNWPITLFTLLLAFEKWGSLFMAMKEVLSSLSWSSTQPKYRMFGRKDVSSHYYPVIILIAFVVILYSAFSRELLQRKIAICVVGYPATPIITARARFCVSASHTRKDLGKLHSIAHFPLITYYTSSNDIPFITADYALEQISEIGETLMLKVSRAPRKKLE